MADDRQIVRKLRKKLRQIETLLCLERALSPEEALKVKSKKEVRNELQQLLSQSNYLDSNNQYKHNDEDSSSNLKPSEIKSVAKETVELNPPLIEHNNELLKKQTSEKPSSQKLLKNTIQSEPPSEVKEVKQQPINVNVSVLASKPPSEANKRHETSISKASASYQPSVKEQAPKLKTIRKTFYSITELIGHHHHVCAVDCVGNLLVSGGKDTSLKVWNLLTSEEHLSIGGHTGTITSIAIVDKQKDSNFPFDELLKKFSKVVTASTDCSICIWDISKGKQASTIYTYSPVTCMDVAYDMILSGSDGGKVNLWSLDDGREISSILESQMRINVVKIINQGSVASCDGAGRVRLYKLDGISLEAVWFHNPSFNLDYVEGCSVSVYSSINCMAVKTNNTIAWTDNGLNVKLCNTKTDQVRKIRSSRNAYCSADAMFYNDIHKTLLVSAFNIDVGHSEINSWSLKDSEDDIYLGTVASPRFGHIYSCGSTSYVDNKGHCHDRIFYGGSSLGIVDQIKYKEGFQTEHDVIELERLRHCEVAQDTSSESDEESDSDNDDISINSSNEEETSTSWCSIL